MTPAILPSEVLYSVQIVERNLLRVQAYYAAYQIYILVFPNSIFTKTEWIACR